jgi:hypothetical protein
MDTLLKRKGDVKYSKHNQFPQIIAIAFRQKVFADYRKLYGCVDLANQFHMKWLFLHKHQKWTRALFHSFLKIVAVNDWLLWKELNNVNTNQKDFLLELVVQMRNEINSLDPQLSNPRIQTFHLIQRSPTRGNCKFCLITKKKRN